MKGTPKLTINLTSNGNIVGWDTVRINPKEPVINYCSFCNATNHPDNIFCLGCCNELATI